jgi:hypothetical protein
MIDERTQATQDNVIKDEELKEKEVNIEEGKNVE